jgi:hypothetical protein
LTVPEQVAVTVTGTEAVRPVDATALIVNDWVVVDAVLIVIRPEEVTEKTPVPLEMV